MEVLNMFPVAGLSDLNNADLAFLDEICTSGNNQHIGINNMTDLNSIGSSSVNGLHAPSADWLSGNIGVDTGETVSGEISVPQTVEFDHVFSPNILNSSCVNFPAFTTESSSNTFETDVLTDNTFFIEMLSPEERIYPSSDDLGEKLIDLHHDKSPLISESEEIIDHNVEDDYNIAGKKYLQMRQKNNIASQRSRKLRKQKNSEMMDRLKKLERENEHLTKLAAELEKQRDALQRQLLHIVARK